MNGDSALAGALTRLLLGCANGEDLDRLRRATTDSQRQFERLCDLNRVLVRTTDGLAAAGVPIPPELQTVASSNRERVRLGMELIAEVSELLQSSAIPFMVIKTLDHYPDQGHDIDLYLDGEAGRIDRLMRDRLGGTPGSRSLCDVLAGKTGYRTENGLTLEIHRSRLGQAGEHRALAAQLLSARRRRRLAGISTWVPSPEGQLLLAVLQRMYRHFNFRLCDVVTFARLLQREVLDWTKVVSLARVGGLERGVRVGIATVSDLLRGLGVAVTPLPAELAPAPGGTLRLSFARSYFRFPLVPVVPGLYARELGAALRRRALDQAMRLFGLAGVMAVVGINLSLFPSAGLWRRLW